ncbi:MAG: immune inhibitor A [Candidatus Cloacimonetes bacterium]|nr:immune inhibitor A [Candidatus Cloacimonadota bacterium]
MKRILLGLIILLVFIVNIFAVLPHPLKKTGIIDVDFGPSEIFAPQNNVRTNNVPDSLLVLMVEFNDIKFDLIPDYPDSLAHDFSYFERYLIHLNSYVTDASHGKYVLENNYTIMENVVTLPENMSYYGNDEYWVERVCELVQTSFQNIDNEIDFNDFDSFLIFHAGAGQEADLTGNNEDELWSTFISRKTLQAGLDPENDEFPGLLFDGKYIKEIAILPETEWQPDNVEGEHSKYGLLGVLVHEFGHQLGLPTLFDNNSSNGRSFGIGNFGVMGTGAWNAKGFVPPLPCAWSRYFLGWEDDYLVEIDSDATDLEVLYPQDVSLQKKVFKINISENEYFLIENRQQNPDGSDLNGFPNFTFELLPEGEQDYYPPPNDNVPVFNFMENSYAGCEWDFWFPGPGYGDPPEADNITIDGSGLFIWHIDENIIDAYFSPDFEMNSVNADASHKGVDLEEADGIQHLDAVIDQNSLGSPFDSFREGNSNYFGLETNPETEQFSFPTAESYYGGTPIEIYNISESANSMTFSVRFDWHLKADFIGENPYPIAIIDSNNDEIKEIMFVTPDGNIYIWENDEAIPVNDYINTISSLKKLYAYYENSNAFIFPTKADNENSSRVWVLDEMLSNIVSVIDFDNRIWAASPVVNPYVNSSKRCFLPLNRTDYDSSEIIILDNDFIENCIFVLDGNIATNLVYISNFVFAITSQSQGNFILTKIELNDEINSDSIELSQIPTNSDINSFIIADIDNNDENDYIITVNDSLLYVYSPSGDMKSGFPVTIPVEKATIPCIGNLSGTGFLDIIYGKENSFVAIDYLANIKQPSTSVDYPDSLGNASEFIAFDINGDDKQEVIGIVSKNRLCVWENINQNDFRIMDDYPVSFNKKIITSPTIEKYNEKVYVFVTANDGFVYRHYLGDITEQENWNCEYGNLQRTASYLFTNPDNILKTSSIFIDDEIYIYPNPFNNINNQSIFNGVTKEDIITLRLMLSKDAFVKIKIYDVAANIILEEKIECKAYIQSAFDIDARKLSSGVYFVIIKADNEVKKLKFAIEK